MACVSVIPIPKGDAKGSGPAWWETNGWVIVRCPNGHTCAIMHPLRRKLNHDILADGTVSPSLVCPGTGKNDCTWHVFVRLEGWLP